MSNKQHKFPHLSDYAEEYRVKHSSLRDVYDVLSQLTLPIPDLVRMGYPVPHNDYGMGITSCDRCHKKLTWDQLEQPITYGKCLYHVGNFVGTVKGGKEIYDCCDTASPCCETFGHLCSNEDKRGQKYFDFFRAKASDRKPKIFAIDTERVSYRQIHEQSPNILIVSQYVSQVTVVGNTVRRCGQRPFHLAMIDGFTAKSVIDSWVEKDPHSTIIDYNTRFHGYTCPEIEAMRGWAYYPLRNHLTRTLIKQQDILIGHDLTGDLKSLKMFHYNIIDTSDMFRSSDGRKQKLEDVVLQNLGLKFDAHDAANDAYACLLLVLDRLRRDYGIY